MFSENIFTYHSTLQIDMYILKYLKLFIPLIDTYKITEIRLCHSFLKIFLNPDIKHFQQKQIVSSFKV